MMKDINEVLRKKEADLQQLQREVEALRVAARLLSEETEAATAFVRSAAPGNSYASQARPAPPAVGTIEAGYGASWDAAAKKFP
jgi:hypothetical protein